jgi:hypothetical protein
MADLPGRQAVLARPGFVFALALVVAWLAAWLMGASYDRLNQEDPQAPAAKALLGGCLLVAALGLVGCVALLGRQAAWLVLPGLGGLFLLGNVLEDAWAHWGMDWDGSTMLVPPVLVVFALFGLGLVGLTKRLGPRRASRTVAFPLAFFLVPTAVFAISLLLRFSEVTRDADANWSSEHGDPSLGAVVVAVLLLGLAARRLHRRA